MASSGRPAGGSSGRPICLDLDEPIDLTEPDAKRQRTIDQRPRAVDQTDMLRRQLAAVQAQLAASIARAGAAQQGETAAKAEASERVSELLGQLSRARTSLDESRAKLYEMEARLLDAKEERREADLDPQPFLRALEAQRLSVGRTMGALRAHTERHELTRRVLAQGGALGAAHRRSLSNAPGSLWSEGDRQMGRPWHLSVQRQSLGTDLLRELERLVTPFDLFCKPRVTYQGEPGQDERGLTVDLFAKSFGALREVQLPAVGGGNEIVPGTLGRSGEAAGSAHVDAAHVGTPCHHLFESFPTGLNLPARDPPTGASSSGGSSQSRNGSGPLTSVCAWRLIGRLLAWQLRQPEGLYVDDRLPPFALEWLATGEAASLATTDGALEALRQMHGTDDGVVGYCKNCLTRPFTELAIALLREPTLSDMLPHGYWELCEPATAPDKCACSRTALSDEGKQAAFLAAIRYTYIDSRRAHLRALREGFDASDGGLSDFGPVLRLTPPAALARRLRGEPVRDGAVLWAGIDVLRQEEDDADSRWRKATVEELERVHGWLQAYVCALKSPAARLLLRFITGVDTLATGSGHRPSILVYNDWEHPCTSWAHLPTVSTCAQQLYLPVYPSKQVFRSKLLETLHVFRYREKNGESGFDYA